MAKETSHIEVDANGHGAKPDQGFINPDLNMLILTWVTFFLLLAVLHKFAWKPILSALDAREKHIRDSIEDADKIKAEMEKLAETQKQLMDETGEKAKAIMDESRQAAKEAANTIQEKAKEESKIILENARREINEEKEKAQSELREESAEIAVALAGKIIEQNLDKEKNRKLINQYINDI